MKLWFGYSSEHSSNLVMIGRFKNVADATEAKEIIDQIAAQVRSDERAGLIQIGESTDRFPEDVRQLLERAKIYTIGPAELEQFVYDVTIGVENTELVLRTDEIDVSAFLKVLIGKGARVELYSAHDYPRTGEDQHG